MGYPAERKFNYLLYLVSSMKGPPTFVKPTPIRSKHFFLVKQTVHSQLFLLQAEETPLHIAARIKDGEKVAEMLIKSGADVNAPSDVRNNLLPRSHQ